jgi:hypothetical protein
MAWIQLPSIRILFLVLVGQHLVSPVELVILAVLHDQVDQGSLAIAVRVLEVVLKQITCIMESSSLELPFNISSPPLYQPIVQALCGGGHPDVEEAPHQMVKCS